MRLFALAIVQSLLLCSGQVFLKFALEKMGAFAWKWSFFPGAAHQLVVVGVRCLLWCRRGAVDAHSQELSLFPRLSAHLHELRLRDVRRMAHFPRDGAHHPLGRRALDHGGLLLCGAVMREPGPESMQSDYFVLLCRRKK